jgi:hypothetical protein
MSVSCAIVHTFLVHNETVGFVPNKIAHINWRAQLFFVGAQFFLVGAQFFIVGAQFFLVGAQFFLVGSQFFGYV